jgi:hypothetical protein
VDDAGLVGVDNGVFAFRSILLHLLLLIMRRILQ